jgi:predicted transcriptional regulator of viral defense system
MTKTKDQKIKGLLRDSRKLYHTQDLAVLWGIDNANTLYTNIKRYVKRGLLNKIHKGFYSTVSLNAVDPVCLGIVGLHRYGYVSTESILAKEGLIFQDVRYITLVSDVSERFEIAGHKFLARRMKDDYLYNEVGIIVKENVRIASVERAVADMLYFNPNYHFDAKSSIDWKKVEEIRSKIGY